MPSAGIEVSTAPDRIQEISEFVLLVFVTNSQVVVNTNLKNANIGLKVPQFSVVIVDAFTQTIIGEVYDVSP